jgi:hypothetical protein
MARLKAAISNHPRGALATAVAVVVFVGFVLVWFEPQALIIDRRVDEDIPALSTGARNDAGGSDENRDGADGGDRSRLAGSDPEPKILARGELRGINHTATGDALLIRLADGSHLLRFENLLAENGPDLRVYLSSASASEEGPAFNDDYVELGELKGNIGNQNYEIPDDVDLNEYVTPVIWCKRFEVGFAVAALE